MWSHGIINKWMAALPALHKDQSPVLSLLVPLNTGALEEVGTMAWLESQAVWEERSHCLCGTWGIVAPQAVPAAS